MKKMRSAKQVRTVNNILVHTALAILAVSDPVGDTYQLPCGEGVLCVHIFPEGIYTG